MLVESEKMAALGALVAGVAHELNTPIGVGVTISSTLLEKNQELVLQLEEQTLRKSVLAEYVSENQQGLDILSRNLAQAANLVNSFKKVAVDQASDQRRDFDLAETVHHVIQTMQVLFDSHIELVSLVPDGLEFDSYPGALVQILNNLIANAETHGFVGREHGKVTIRAEAISSEGVKLIVSDDGLGIDPEHLAHIFEPFFTTKLGQGGSGLGLSIVYNLVTSILGGKIEVLSQINVGTTFTIQLPLRAPIKANPKDA
jgi:signal transduction histidine kinase